jgi:hypothetical protein
MKVKDFISFLSKNDLPVTFCLPEGNCIPSNFHITEVGRVNKFFVDCGGTKRQNSTCSLQIWVADDKDHRLTSNKLVKIFNLGSYLFVENLEIEVEYGINAISCYVLDNVKVNENEIIVFLEDKKTDCLAPDKCGISQCNNKGCC